MEADGNMKKFLTLCFVFCISFFTIISASFTEELPKPLAAQMNADSPMNKIFVETAQGHQQWIVDLASDQGSRSRGLMYVSSMPIDRGMLFRFDESQMVAMWMQNTFLPLDMIFLDDTGKISHIHLNARPHSRQIISSQQPVRYVLEINAGEADRRGLVLGQVMRHPWFRATQ